MLLDVCDRKEIKNLEMTSLHLPGQQQHKLCHLPAVPLRQVKLQLLVVLNHRRSACRKKARRWCWVDWWSWNQRSWWKRSSVDTFHWACWTRWRAGCLPRCSRKLWIFSPSPTVRQLHSSLNLRPTFSHVSIYHYELVVAGSGVYPSARPVDGPEALVSGCPSIWVHVCNVHACSGGGIHRLAFCHLQLTTAVSVYHCCKFYPFNGHIYVNSICTRPLYDD